VAETDPLPGFPPRLHAHDHRPLAFEAGETQGRGVEDYFGARRRSRERGEGRIRFTGGLHSRVGPAGAGEPPALMRSAPGRS